MKNNLHFESGKITPTVHNTKSAYRSAQTFLQVNADYIPAIIPPTTAEDAEAIYNTLRRDAYNVLNFLYAKQPAPILHEIRAGIAATRAAMGNTYAAEIADNADKLAQEYRKDAAEMLKDAHKITAADTDRADLLNLAETLKQAADEQADQRDNANTAHGNTLAADMLHAGYIAAYTRPTPAEIDKAAEILGDNATAEQILYHAEQSHRHASMRAWIREQAHGINALDGTSIKYIPADRATVKAWRDKYGDNSDEPQTTKSGTKQLIHQETTTKSRPAGYYIKYTSKTFRRASSFDFISDEGAEGIKVSYNFYIGNQSAYEELTDLYTRAELTPRELQYMQAFCSYPAIKAGEQARTEYRKAQAEKGQKASAEGISGAEYKARKEYAAKRIGLQAERTKQQIFSTIREKLKAAANAPTNKAPEHKLSYKDYNKMVCKNHGIRYTEAPAPAGAWKKCPMFARLQNPYTPAIKWTEEAHAEPVKPAEIKEQAEQEHNAANIRVFVNFVRDNLQDAPMKLSAMSAEEITKAAQAWTKSREKMLITADKVERNNRHTCPASASREEKAVFDAERKSIRKAATDAQITALIHAANLIKA